MNIKFLKKTSLIFVSAAVLSAILTITVRASNTSVQSGSTENCEQFRAELLLRLPDFTKFGKCQKNKVELFDKNNKSIGILLLAPAGKYQRKEGFNGYINTAVLLDKNNKVTGVILGKNSETPRWIQRLHKAGFLDKWNGKTVKEASQLEVDAVTRATYSSEAIKQEVKAITAQGISEH